MRKLLSVTYLLLALCFSNLTAAEASEWTVERASAPAQMSTDGQTWTPLSPGMAVPDRSTIHTGARGRVLLRHGAETILFAPNSLAAVAGGRGGATTEVVQRVGALVLQIEKRDRSHTRV